MDQGRRKTLGILGTAIGVGTGNHLLRGTSATAAASPPSLPPLPWPYVELDPKAVTERAYWAYFDGHCMYSVFAGLIQELAASKGYPFTNFPLELMKYGAGGVVGWGTLCGTLNGAAAAIYLTSQDPTPVIDEVFWWYSNEKLPQFVPEENPKPVPASVARSTLCHVSVARWCEETGLDAYSKERNERCARLAADTARYTAETLNRQLNGTLTLLHPAPDHVQQCRSCHDRGGQVENARGRMDCGTCHGDLPETHPETARTLKSK